MPLDLDQAALDAAYRTLLEGSVACGRVDNISDDEAENSAWLRDVAEPWWAGMRERAHADGLEITTDEDYAAHPPWYYHAPCARLAAPNGSEYPTDRRLEAAHRDYGDRLAAAQRRVGITQPQAEIA